MTLLRAIMNDPGVGQQRMQDYLKHHYPNPPGCELMSCCAVVMIFEADERPTEFDDGLAKIVLERHPKAVEVAE